MNWLANWEDERDDREAEIIKHRPLNAPDLERFTLVELRLLAERLQNEIKTRMEKIK